MFCTRARVLPLCFLLRFVTTSTSREFLRTVSTPTHASMATQASDTAVGDAVVVYITTPGDKPEVAGNVARELVNTRLAACVNVIPAVQSFYRWEGETQSDAEQLLIVKTRQSLVPAIGDALKRVHPYDVPELIALPIVTGSADYLKWLHAETETK